MATLEELKRSGRFGDLLEEFRKKFESKKHTLIQDEVFWSEHDVTVLDLLGALHAEQMDLQDRVNNRAGELSTFPGEGNIMAVPSGRTVLDLVEGTAEVQKLTGKKYNFTGLKTLKTDKFRSASLFIDQPANVRIDERPSFPVAMGVNRIHTNMREKLEINSAVPMSIAFALSTGDQVPIEAVRGGYDFWRFGALAETGNSFTGGSIRMRPKSIDFSLRGSVGIFTRTVLPTSALSSDDEGIPVVAGLKQFTIMVENEATANSANVRTRVNTGEGETKGAHPITGDNGIPIPAGDFAILNFDNENFYRIETDAKSTISGSSAGTIKATMKGVWE